MTEKISVRQAAKLHAALHPTLGFLTVLEQRLLDLGIPATDAYYQKVAAARDAMHRLVVDTHYKSCASGVGRPVRE